jgi:hypothetical protein
MMMALTLSLPQVLAHAEADTAVVPGMASVIPAASNAPVTFDFMVPPEWLVLFTIPERRPRRARGDTGLDTGLPAVWISWPTSGYHVALCSSGGVSQLREFNCHIGVATMFAQLGVLPDFASAVAASAPAR